MFPPELATWATRHPRDLLNLCALLRAGRRPLRGGAGLRTRTHYGQLTRKLSTDDFSSPGSIAPSWLASLNVVCNVSRTVTVPIC